LSLRKKAGDDGWQIPVSEDAARIVAGSNGVPAVGGMLVAMEECSRWIAT
jgi:hypothetical protein